MRMLSTKQIEEAAKQLFAEGVREGWWASGCPSVTTYENLDPIAKEEFNEIVIRVLLAADW